MVRKVNFFYSPLRSMWCCIVLHNTVMHMLLTWGDNEKKSRIIEKI